MNTPERWDKIAATVPGRTKKDCMKRYKVGAPRQSETELLSNNITMSPYNDRSVFFPPSQELVEMIKAKKAAQEQVAAKSKK